MNTIRSLGHRPG